MDNEDWIINNLIEEDLHTNFHNKYGNNIYLTDKEKEVLERYDFNVNNYSDVKSLIFDISEYLDDNMDLELDDLEGVETSLMEYNYYHNTNK